MTNKYGIFKRFLKISLLLVAVVAGTPAPANALFDWFFSLFSSTSKAASLAKLKISLYDGKKLDQREPDPEIEVQSIQKPTVLILWTLGCGPCFQELAIFNKLAKKIRESGGEVVSVLLYPDWGQAVASLAHFGKTWDQLFQNLPEYYDRHGHIREALKVEAAPMVVFLDASGAVLETVSGLQEWSLESVQEKLKLTPETPPPAPAG